jgi:S1-C subfamily serine protease
LVISSSAVNLALCLLTLVSGIDQNLSSAEKSLWTRVKNSFAYIEQGGKTIGIAALIDSSGLYIVSRSNVVNRVLDARLPSGATFQLRLAAEDDPTQLALLIAEKWKGEGQVALEVSEITKSWPMIAVTPSGPSRMELANDQKYGVLTQSNAKRVMPLSELKFESSEQLIGGAFVISSAGQLVGVVDATLRGAVNQKLNSTPGMNADFQPALQNRFGPNSLTVGYAIAPAVLKRVVEGFRSPSRIVLHPAIGVFCINNVGGGALVQSVVAKSPAEKAGFAPGDVIVDIAGNTIGNQGDFGRVLMGRSVGETIPVRIKRGKKTMVLDVIVGS